MNRIETDKLTRALEAVASEAAGLYPDEPLDYKGRCATHEGVLGIGKSAHCLDVLVATLQNTCGQKILDVGIAYGIYAVVLKRSFGFELFGIDHPENVEVYCRFPKEQGITVLPCDVHFDSIPYEDRTFDTVIASEIVEHLLVSPKAFFSRIYPVLKPGGTLVVTTPNFANLRNILYVAKGRNPAATFPDEASWVDRIAKDVRVHPREYTCDEIGEALLAAGFKISTIYTTNNKCQPGARVRAKLLNKVMGAVPKRGERIIAVGMKSVE
ncbi:MAG: methyltransferase domain-containing protein [Thermodesulfobacteriota bacterium]|nr:methyltransferase domain-containing protein [Thermodesulfobacteriota bacterium]